MLIYLTNALIRDIDKAYSALNSLFYTPYRNVGAFKKAIKNNGLAYHKNTLYHAKDTHYLDQHEPKLLCHSLDEFIQRVNEERLLSIL